MTPRGPKPTPRNLRIVRGTDRPDRMNEREPIVPVSVPDPPDHLTDAEECVFREVGAKLARMRVMTEYDADALAILAVNTVRWREATQKVREMGMIVKSPTGYPIQNPFLAIANKAQKTCLDVLTEFGMTPSSRTRVQAH